jgi:hypothetical protein
MISKLFENNDRPPAPDPEVVVHRLVTAGGRGLLHSFLNSLQLNRA